MKCSSKANKAEGDGGVGVRVPLRTPGGLTLILGGRVSLWTMDCITGTKQGVLSEMTWPGQPKASLPSTPTSAMVASSSWCYSTKPEIVVVSRKNETDIS